MEIFCMVHVYGCKVWRENTNRFWVHVHCIRYFVHPLRIHVFSIGLYKTQNYSRLSFQANDFFLFTLLPFSGVGDGGLDTGKSRENI